VPRHLADPPVPTRRALLDGRRQRRFDHVRIWAVLGSAVLLGIGIPWAVALGGAS
jgi:hypothetical protein